MIILIKLTETKIFFKQNSLKLFAKTNMTLEKYSSYIKWLSEQSVSEK